MILLDSTLKSLEVVLAGAKTTTDCPYVSSFMDISQSTFGMSGASSSDGTSNGVTTVAVIAAPAASTTRQVKYFSLFNADTAAVTPTIRYNDNATIRKIITVTLQVGERLDFICEKGWTTFDNVGNVKQSFSYPTEPVNTVLAGPSSGSAAVPTFRSLVLADLPEATTGAVLYSQGVSTPSIYTTTPTISGVTLQPSATGSYPSIDTGSNPLIFTNSSNVNVNYGNGHMGQFKVWDGGTVNNVLITPTSFGFSGGTSSFQDKTVQINTGFIPPSFLANGGLTASTIHIVNDTITAPAGVTTTVTFSGNAIFANTQYNILITNETTFATITPATKLTTGFTFPSVASTVYTFTCIGA
jgi:hypothetical protein